MKDFKFPVASKEERQRIWDNLKQNDKLAYVECKGWARDYYIRYFTVVKKTPKGSVRLDNGELLKYFNSNYYIVNDEFEKCIDIINLEKQVMDLLYEANRDKVDFKSNLQYEDGIKLKEILEKALNK